MTNPCSDVTLSFEGYQIAKGGRVVPVLNSAHCFTLEGRDVVLINSRDLTLLKKTENSLKESEERLSSILEGSFEGISITENGKVIDANPQMAEMLGYTLDELIGKKVTDFVAPVSKGLVSRMMNDEHRSVYEHEALKKDGSVINVEVRGNETFYRGRTVRITAIRDISYRKRVEERLRAILEEKEILLNEIRHRVKTNLQGVLGLLDFQASSLQDEEAHRAFRESQNRILTMALIHEKLYEVDDLNRIDFGIVVENLASHLARVYRTSDAGIQIETDIAGVKLNMDTAVPCGLIINELVSGLLQNGGMAESDSSVAVKMTQCTQKGFKLLVTRNRDDNYGHAVAQAMSSPSKLLVESLVEQLSGTMSVSVEKGTAYKIAFMEYFEAGTELH
jgi:PAS domain S-box-containing protein